MRPFSPVSAFLPYGTAATLPGLALAGAIALGAVMLRFVTGVGELSPMIVAIFIGLAVGWLARPTETMRPGLRLAGSGAMRLGVMLLGTQITFAGIVSLGWAVFLAVAATLVASFLFIRFAGQVMGLPRPLVTLIAAGTSVCGASAVIGANAVARGSAEDTGYAVACVTLYGLVLMIALPLLAPVLGLDPVTGGLWIGTSLHEVAQVTAAAFHLGDEAGQAGTVSKLARVLMLAPLVLLLSRESEGATSGPAPMPWFVLGFIVLVAVNSLIAVPATFTAMGGLAAVFLMAMGMGAIGVTLDLGRLRSRGIRPLLLGGFGTLFIASFGYLALSIAV